MSIFFIFKFIVVNDLKNHYNNDATYSKFNEHSDVRPGLSEELNRRDKIMLSKERTAEIVKKYGKNEKDTGSAQVQIALLTAQINDLTVHLKNNKKDASGRRGLFVLVGQRRALLNYLNKTDRDAYVKLLSELKIRK